MHATWSSISELSLLCDSNTIMLDRSDSDERDVSKFRRRCVTVAEWSHPLWKTVTKYQEASNHGAVSNLPRHTSVWQAKKFKLEPLGSDQRMVELLFGFVFGDQPSLVTLTEDSVQLVREHTTLQVDCGVQVRRSALFACGALVLIINDIPVYHSSDVGRLAEVTCETLRRAILSWFGVCVVTLSGNTLNWTHVKSKRLKAYSRLLA